MKVRYLDESGEDAIETYDRGDLSEGAEIDIRPLGELEPLQAVEIANDLLDRQKAASANGRP